jgi:hypothetical protein
VGDNIDTMKKNTEVLIDASKEVGLEVNTKKTKYSETSIYRSRIRRSISMVPERILFKLWLPHLLFSRIHCFFFRPPTKKMNRGFTVYVAVSSP